MINEALAHRPDITALLVIRDTIGKKQKPLVIKLSGRSKQILSDMFAARALFSLSKRCKEELKFYTEDELDPTISMLSFNDSNNGSIVAAGAILATTSTT